MRPKSKENMANAGGNGKKVPARLPVQARRANYQTSYQAACQSFARLTRHAATIAGQRALRRAAARRLVPAMREREVAKLGIDAGQDGYPS